MFGDSKYSNLLTVLLVIVIIAIIALLIFFGIDIYKKYYITKETNKGVEQFDDEIPDIDTNNINNTITNNGNTTNNTVVDNDPLANLIDPDSNSSSGGSSGSDGLTYKGFPMIGTISIPKTDVSLPILANATKQAIEVSVAKQYGLELNKPGNVVIIGHNYRNGLFFSDNKKLEVGDKVYIKDTSGLKLEYTIYSKFETDQSDVSFYDRDTNGKCEITLSTCVDNNAERRLVLLARSD